MKNIYLIYVFVLLLCSVSCDEIKKKEVEIDEINPHSFYLKRDSYLEDHVDITNEKLTLTENNKMNTKGVSKNVFLLNYNVDEDNKRCDQKTISNKCTEIKKEIDMYKIYYGRLINMLHENMFIKSQNEFYTEGFIKIGVTKNDLYTLQNHENVPLKTIDDILSRIILMPTNAEDFIESLISKNLVDFVIENKVPFFLIIVSATFAFIVWKYCPTFIPMFSFLVLCVISHSWYITHQNMIVNMEYKTQYICNDVKSFFEPVTQLFVGKEKKPCTEQLEVNSPPQQITLLESFSVMWANFLFKPIAILGEALGDFSANITKRMDYLSSVFTNVSILPYMIFSLIIVILAWFGKFSLFTRFGGLSYEPNKKSYPERIEPAVRCCHENTTHTNKLKTRKAITGKHSCSHPREQKIKCIPYKLKKEKIRKKKIKQYQSSSSDKESYDSNVNESGSNNETSDSEKIEKIGSEICKAA